MSDYKWLGLVAVLMLIWAGTAIALVEARHKLLFQNTIYIEE